MSKLEVAEMDLSNLTDVQLDVIRMLTLAAEEHFDRLGERSEFAAKKDRAHRFAVQTFTLASRIRKEKEERALDWIYQETLKGEEAEGHWPCHKFSDIDSDHGPCTGYEIEDLGITIYTYVNDDTRISVHREEAKK